MERALFEKIRYSHYANFISFAIWNDNDINNLSAIEENIENLNQNIVIIGLNVYFQAYKILILHFHTPYILLEITQSYKVKQIEAKSGKIHIGEFRKLWQVNH